MILGICACFSAHTHSTHIFIGSDSGIDILGAIRYNDVCIHQAQMYANHALSCTSFFSRSSIFRRAFSTISSRRRFSSACRSVLLELQPSFSFFFSSIFSASAAASCCVNRLDRLYRVIRSWCAVGWPAVLGPFPDARPDPEAVVLGEGCPLKFGGG